MNTTTEFYLARAAENAKAARETNLVNVRERCLRAEAAWRTMADRLIEIERNKRKLAADKAALEVPQGASVGASDIPWPIAPIRPLPRRGV